MISVKTLIRDIDNAFHNWEFLSLRSITEPHVQIEEESNPNVARETC